MFGFGKSKKRRAAPAVASSETMVGAAGTLDSLDVVPGQTTDGIIAACRIQRRLFRKDPVRLAEIDEAAIAFKDALKLSTAGGDLSEYERFKRLRNKSLN